MGHKTNSKQVIWAKLMERVTVLAVPVRQLFWSISSHFIAIHPWSVHRSRKLPKTLKPHILRGSRSFKVIDVNTAKKLVTNACYDKQHVCAYMQLFSC